MLLEFGDKVLVLLVGELAGVVFKDSLCSLATGCVEKHDRGNIIPVRFCDAFSEQYLYFIKRFHPGFCGWHGFRIKVDLVGFSHVVY